MRAFGQSSTSSPCRRDAALSVTCMAHPRRIARVAKQIEREVGTLIIYDKVVQDAICPERRRGLDGALSALASVTEVEVSNDLQVAKVFLSIYSDDAGRAAAINGLRRLEGYVRHHVGQAVRLRLTPEIRFILDESIERSERVLKLLEQSRAIQEGRSEPPPVVIGGSNLSEDFGSDEQSEGSLSSWFDDDAKHRPAADYSVDLGFFQEKDVQRGSASKLGPNGERRSQERRYGRKQGRSKYRRESQMHQEDAQTKDGSIEITIEEFEATMEMFERGEEEQ